MAVQNSILTNVSSLTALRTLNFINDGLSSAQNRISIGVKVSGAIDDALNFSIAQGLRAELAALSAVKTGLANAGGVGKVAVAGATGVSNLMQDIRAKLTELSNEGITTAQRNILSNDSNQLLSQAANFVANATFNNINLLESGASNINTLANLNGGTLALTAQSIRPLITSLAGATFATSTN
jgi:flagellin